MDRRALNTLGLNPEDVKGISTEFERPERADLSEVVNLMDDRLMNLFIFGTPKEWAERIEKLRELGMNHLAIWLRQEETGNGIRLIGEDVLPSFVS